MQRFGDAAGKTVEGHWQEEVASIGQDRIPNAEKLQTLREQLCGLNPNFIAMGHGFCINCS